MVRRAHERFKRVPLFTLSREGVSVQLNNTGKLIAGRVDWYMKMLEKLHPSLPPELNVTLPINMFDEPLSWVTPLPTCDEAALRNGALTLKEAWFKHACDAVGLSQYRTLHGSFLNPPAIEFDHEMLPVLSPYAIPGCFAGGGFWWCPPCGTLPCSVNRSDHMLWQPAKGLLWERWLAGICGCWGALGGW